MKAIRIHTYGGPEVLSYEDAPLPVVGEDEVLVRVYGAGVNPADWRTRTGGTGAGSSFPLILGWDISGVVEATGPAVTQFGAGDAVYGMIRFPAPGSAYAEYTTAPVAHIAPKPATLDHVHAAAVPLAALTAWQTLFEKAHLQEGQRVLINGASGGVGHLAVQLAKAKGAFVIGVASGQNADFLRRLGVDQVIDYTMTPVQEAVRDVDVVLDTVGGSAEQRDHLIDTLKRGGIYVSIVFGQPSPERVAAAGVTATGHLVYPSSTQLVEIGRLIDEGKVQVIVEHELPLAEARKAHEQSESRRTRGKIVLVP